MSDNSNKPEDEVELGKLFILIGSAINTFFNKIIGLFKALFHYLIISLLFLKKNIIVLAVATIIGGLIGYFFFVNSDKNYYSEMVLDTNYESGVELYKQTEFLNKLINTKDFKNLSKVLNINENVAKTITNIDIEPYYPEQYILKEYDDYIKNTDTIYTKDFTIEDFKKRHNDQDYRLQKITISGSDKELFVNLNNNVIGLVNNDYFKDLLKTKKAEFERRKKILQKNLSYIDSLRKVYKEIDLLIAQKNSTVATNNINLVDKPDNKNRDIELFKESNHILYELKALDKEILKNGYIIKPVSKFNIGEKSTKIKDKLWFKYAVYGFIVGLLSLLAIKFNRYLDNYRV
jgi:hypothetical protein